MIDVVEAVGVGDERRPGPDGIAGPGAPGSGPGPVGPMLTALAEAPVGCGPDREFRAALLAELTRRHLRAVRRHARGLPVPQVWQVVLDGWRGPGDPVRTALAGAHALVGYDLPPAVVSACTVLARVPGRAEREVVQSVVEHLAGMAAAGAAPLDSGEAWHEVQQLWTVRGRPSEADRERAALDRRAADVARALLA